MGLNEEIDELSECLTEEQLVEYVIRVTKAEKQLMKYVREFSGGNATD